MNRFQRFNARTSGLPFDGETRQAFLKRLSMRRLGQVYHLELLREVVALREELDALRARVRTLEER